MDVEREPIRAIKNQFEIKELVILPDHSQGHTQQPRAEIIHEDWLAPRQTRGTVTITAHPEIIPFTKFLKSVPNEQRQIVLRFDEFENMIHDTIPQNAYSQPRWWNNRSQKMQGWGWVIQDVYFKSKTIVLRRKGDYPVRDIPEYMQMLLGDSGHQRQIEPNRLKKWLRFCRQVGWFFEGTMIYEKGLIDTNGLSEHDKLEAEEDYSVCKKEISRYKNIKQQ